MKSFQNLYIILNFYFTKGDNMSRIKETGKYLCYIAKAELMKKTHYPDLVLIPDKKYKGAKETRLIFVNFNKKDKTVTFKITKRDHKF